MTEEKRNPTALDIALAEPPRDDGKILGASIDGVIGQPELGDMAASAAHDRLIKATAEKLVASGKLKLRDVPLTPSKKMG